MSNYVLSATLELKDQFTAQVNKARSGFKDLTETLKSTGSASDAAAAGMGKAGTAAVKAAGQADRAKRAFQGIRGIYEATIRAKDDATAKIQRVKTELNGLKGKTYTVALNIKQNGSLNGLKDKAGSVANGMLLGTSAQMLAGAGIGFGIYDTLKTSMDFSAALSGVKALVPAGEDAEAVMDAVKNKAMELGQATAFGDVDVANGMAELLKAGLSLQEVLNGATKAALDLATAGDLSLPEAAKTMSIMMNVFDLNDASHAADILTGAANASATNVHEMSYAMAEAAAGAKSMGVSFEDTNATLALFAKNGLLGSDAGTSLKTMLSRLVSQTDQAAKDFQRLGLMSEDGSNKFFDATGKLKPMREVAETLKKSLQGMTAEQKQAALYTIFGSDAIRAATFLAQDGAEGIDKMTAAMKRFTASGVAETKMDNLRGDIEQLSGSWENLQILIMDGKGENGLRSFVQEADKLLSHFSGNVEKNGLGIRSILSLIGEGIKDLKDKFLAFDGIGSVLAGGALAVGLKKIYNLAMKVKDVIQGIPKNLPGGTPTGGNGLPSTSSVKDMIVTATNVIINSKGAPTSAPPTNAPVPAPVPGGTPKGTPTGSGWAARLGSWARRVPWIGSALALGGTALDVAYAPEGEKLSTAGRDAAGLAGGFAGMKLGASAGAALGSVVPGAGTAAGAIVGGIAGGIGGGMLGQKMAEAFQGIDWDSFSQVINEKNAQWLDTFAQLGPAVANTFSDIRQSASDTDDWLTGKQAEFHQYMADSWEGIKQAGSDAWGMICQVADEKNAEWSQTFADAKDAAGGYLAELEESAGTTWEEISSGASSMESNIASAFQSAKDEAEAAWDGVTGWFEENVWGPLSERARSAWSNLQTTIADIRSSASSFSFSIPSIFDHKATGSSFYAGGWTEINERGGEIVDLPQGSRIYPHATTERMIQAELESRQSSSSGPVVIKGNTFYVREEADIDRIAYKLAKLISQGHINYGGGY